MTLGYSIKCYSCLEAKGSSSKAASVFLNSKGVKNPSVLCPDVLTDAQLVSCLDGLVCVKIDVGKFI